MRQSYTQALLFATALLASIAAPAGSNAFAQGSSGVSVYQYAVDNPVGDSSLSLAPTLGETVPQKIELIPLEGNSTYAYFYYNGSPVIVDLTTRSVVRIGG
ncbi:MAG: hypothetical protein H7Y08_01120 [Rhizobiaceae bacterium]|nr:hypothetical protein [Rhizobiaceae bacterium]